MNAMFASTSPHARQNGYISRTIFQALSTSSGTCLINGWKHTLSAPYFAMVQATVFSAKRVYRPLVTIFASFVLSLCLKFLHAPLMLSKPAPVHNLHGHILQPLVREAPQFSTTRFHWRLCVATILRLNRPFVHALWLHRMAAKEDWVTRKETSVTMD